MDDLEFLAMVTGIIGGLLGICLCELWGIF